VTTGFMPPVTSPETDLKRTASASEVYRETILLELSRGRNTTGIWHDLVDRHGLAPASQLDGGLHRRTRAAPSSIVRDCTGFGNKAGFVLRSSSCESGKTCP